MIAVVGDILLDVFLLPDLQQPEQEGGILIRGGGSAANTAAWLAYLGCPSSFVGCVGADEVGVLLARQLADSGVDARLRAVDGLESGAVAVGVTPEGDRIMRSSRGANQALAPADLRALDGLAPRWLHLTGYALLAPAGLALLAACGDLCRREGISFSFDPGSPSVVAHFGNARLLSALREAGVTLLLPNIWEAEALTGHADPILAAEAMARATPEVIVKNGPNGAVYSSGGVTGSVPTEPIRPLDTTGAGDAFNAGALAAMDRDEGLDEACRAGNQAAGQVIRRYGGRPPR